MKELIKALRHRAIDRHSCLGCGYEHNCFVHGCRIMQEAADELERQQAKTVLTVAEQQAIFRLGQMDMQQSIVLMLRKLADGTMGMARSMLRLAADCVETMNVSDSNTGGAADD